MSSPSSVAEHFACDEPVLVGSDRDQPVFVAAAAQRLDAGRLERLERLGGGLVVLGLDEPIVNQLELPATTQWPRSRLDLAFTPSIDAFRTSGTGWSLADRALTMRIAADPSTGPSDLTIPGHVHPARLRSDDLLARGDTASAALELGRLSGERAAVALSAVTDRDGAFVPLAAARDSGELSHLPLARCEDLRMISRADQAARADIVCELPTRAGVFRVLAHVEDATGETTLALVHGDPAGRPAPLVHVHRACLFADVFASLLCPCRALLDRAVAEMVRDGAGICLYSKPALSTPACGRSRTVDVAVIAGLLRAAGVNSFRIYEEEGRTVAQLRALGLSVADNHGLRSAA
ncbi:MAG TPA: 3,4-dihydroxy-2-butanone-4-phosphate synthase [Solirubrobacteraceae bacterium]|nr:3,4-dihydroxy-2-butanone-4-phosphate synthase [Solirubrobacteraceae bacterium]